MSSVTQLCRRGAAWLGLGLMLFGCTSPGHADGDGFVTEGGSDGGGGAGGSAASGVSFARDLYPTVRSTCAIGGCHELSTTTNHFTDYTTPESTYARWVNGPAFDFCIEGEGFATRTIVVPGHPGDSVLIERISSTRVEPCNSMHHPRMPPPPRSPLSPEQIATWTRWVAEGALQN